MYINVHIYLCISIYVVCTSSRKSEKMARCSTMTQCSSVITKCGTLGGDSNGLQPASSAAIHNTFACMCVCMCVCVNTFMCKYVCIYTYVCMYI